MTVLRRVVEPKGTSQSLDFLLNSQDAGHVNAIAETSETRMERAARIRLNQQRCRARRLAYVASLEQQLRVHEEARLQLDLNLQRVAQRLDAENRRMKSVLHDLWGISEAEIDGANTETLVEIVRKKKARLRDLHHKRDASRPALMAPCDPSPPTPRSQPSPSPNENPSETLSS